MDCFVYWEGVQKMSPTNYPSPCLNSLEFWWSLNHRFFWIQSNSEWRLIECRIGPDTRSWDDKSIKGAACSEVGPIELNCTCSSLVGEHSPRTVSMQSSFTIFFNIIFVKNQYDASNISGMRGRCDMIFFFYLIAAFFAYKKCDFTQHTILFYITLVIFFVRTFNLTWYVLWVYVSKNPFTSHNFLLHQNP